MKTSKVGIVSATILVVVAMIGFGMAQAEGTQAIGEAMESQTPQAASSPAEDMQLNNPTETGSLPTESYADSSKVEGEGYVERQWKGDIDGH
jgi:hypothetical protein